MKLSEAVHSGVILLFLGTRPLPAGVIYQSGNGGSLGCKVRKNKTIPKPEQKCPKSWIHSAAFIGLSMCLMKLTLFFPDQTSANMFRIFLHEIAAVLIFYLCTSNKEKKNKRFHSHAVIGWESVSLQK